MVVHGLPEQPGLPHGRVFFAIGGVWTMRQWNGKNLLGRNRYKVQMQAGTINAGSDLRGIAGRWKASLAR
jgi:hypothetical protein